MVSDAASHETDDKKRRELVEQRNKAENLAYQMEKLLRENQGKLSADTVKQVQDAINGVQQVKASEDADAVKRSVEALESASHKAAEELYRSASPETGGPPNPGAGAGSEGSHQSGDNQNPNQPQSGGDVIDAEFRQA